jgi:hypothetical protein
MSDKKPKSKYWLDRKFQYLEDNFEKYETGISIVFGICIIALPTFFSILATLPGSSNMSALWGWLGAISFWLLFGSGLLLYRNSSRKYTNRKLDLIENKLTNIEAMLTKLTVSITTLTTSVNDLVNEMRRDRNDRNNRRDNDKGDSL